MRPSKWTINIIDHLLILRNERKQADDYKFINRYNTTYYYDY